MTEKKDVVADFWKGIDSHDWELVASTLADDFVRIGMRDDEADTSTGKDTYMDFVSTVVSKMDHHDLRTDRITYSADGRRDAASLVVRELSFGTASRAYVQSLFRRLSSSRP